MNNFESRDDERSLDFDNLLGCNDKQDDSQITNDNKLSPYDNIFGDNSCLDQKTSGYDKLSLENLNDFSVEKNIKTINEFHNEKEFSEHIDNQVVADSNTACRDKFEHRNSLSQFFEEQNHLTNESIPGKTGNTNKNQICKLGDKDEGDAENMEDNEDLYSELDGSKYLNDIVSNNCTKTEGCVSSLSKECNAGDVSLRSIPETQHTLNGPMPETHETSNNTPDMSDDPTKDDNEVTTSDIENEIDNSGINYSQSKTLQSISLNSDCNSDINDKPCHESGLMLQSNSMSPSEESESSDRELLNTSQLRDENEDSIPNDTDSSSNNSCVGKRKRDDLEEPREMKIAKFEQKEKLSDDSEDETLEGNKNENKEEYLDITSKSNEEMAIKTKKSTSSQISVDNQEHVLFQDIIDINMESTDVEDVESKDVGNEDVKSKDVGNEDVESNDEAVLEREICADNTKEVTTGNEISGKSEPITLQENRGETHENIEHISKENRVETLRESNEEPVIENEEETFEADKEEIVKKSDGESTEEIKSDTAEGETVYENSEHVSENNKLETDEVVQETLEEREEDNSEDNTGDLETNDKREENEEGTGDVDNMTTTDIIKDVDMEREVENDQNLSISDKTINEESISRPEGFDEKAEDESLANNDFEDTEVNDIVIGEPFTINEEQMKEMDSSSDIENILEPTEPDALEPTEPGALEYTEPGALEYTEPDALEPTESGALEPTESGALEPTESGALEPTETGALEPTEPGALAPTEPGQKHHVFEAVKSTSIRKSSNKAGSSSRKKASGKKYRRTLFFGSNRKKKKFTPPSRNSLSHFIPAKLEIELPLFLDELASIDPSLIVVRDRYNEEGKKVKVHCISLHETVLDWAMSETLLSSFENSKTLRKNLKLKMGGYYMFPENAESKACELHPVSVGEIFPFAMPRIGVKSVEEEGEEVRLSFPLEQLCALCPSTVGYRVTGEAKRLRLNSVTFADEPLEWAFKETFLSSFEDSPILSDLLGLSSSAKKWPDVTEEILSHEGVDYTFPFACPNVKRYYESLLFNNLSSELPSSLLHETLQLAPLPGNVEKSLYGERDSLVRLLAVASFYKHISCVPTIRSNRKLSSSHSALIESFRPLIISQANRLAVVIREAREKLLVGVTCQDASIIPAMISGPIHCKRGIIFSHIQKLEAAVAKDPNNKLQNI